MIPTFTIHSGEFLIIADILISVVCRPFEKLSEDDCSWLFTTTAVAAAKTFGPPVAAARSARNNRHWVCMCGLLTFIYTISSFHTTSGTWHKVRRFMPIRRVLLVHIVSCTKLAETTKSCQQHNTWRATTQLPGVFYMSNTVIRFLKHGVLLYTHIATWHGSMAYENLGQMFDFPSSPVLLVSNWHLWKKSNDTLQLIWLWCRSDNNLDEFWRGSIAE